jgi:hypothetical protein
MLNTNVMEKIWVSTRQDFGTQVLVALREFSHRSATQSDRVRWRHGAMACDLRAIAAHSGRPSFRKDRRQILDALQIGSGHS